MYPVPTRKLKESPFFEKQHINHMYLHHTPHDLLLQSNTANIIWKNIFHLQLVEINTLGQTNTMQQTCHIWKINFIIPFTLVLLGRYDILNITSYVFIYIFQEH